MCQEDRRPAPPAVLEAWVLATLPRAVAFAASLLNDRARAEDVVHDCYVRLLRKADSYDLPNDGTKLLFKSITNACVDSNSRERRLLSLEAVASEGSGPSALPVDGRAIDPHELTASRELGAAVAEQLGRLPVVQRAAIELRSLGYTLQEIADALATTPGNAGVLVHRARKALADQLAPFLEDCGDE